MLCTASPNNSSDDPAGDSGEWNALLADIEDDALPVYTVGGDAPGFAAPESGDHAPAHEDDLPTPTLGGRPDRELPPWIENRFRKPERGPGAAPAGRWWFGAGILLLALLVQLLHYNRDALAAHPRYGETVQRAYARLGMPLYPQWVLQAFRIRGSEAIGAGSDALEIRATLEIVGDRHVGLPLLRVALRDRWSNTIAGRVFLPDEYLQNRDTPERVKPGTVVPVSISVLDPGPEAQGYELDVCLPRRHEGLQCQAQQDPFRN